MRSIPQYFTLEAPATPRSCAVCLRNAVVALRPLRCDAERPLAAAPSPCWIFEVRTFDRGGGTSYRRGRSTDGAACPSAAPMVCNGKDPMRARRARVAHPRGRNRSGEVNRCSAGRTGFRPKRSSARRSGIRSWIRESPRTSCWLASDSRRGRFHGSVDDRRSGVRDRHVASHCRCQGVEPRRASRTSGR